MKTELSRFQRMVLREKYFLLLLLQQHASQLHNKNSSMLFFSRIKFQTT
jgi:hypothetical protein